jgi:hypothetical protein
MNNKKYLNKISCCPDSNMILSRLAVLAIGY